MQLVNSATLDYPETAEARLVGDARAPRSCWPQERYCRYRQQAARLRAWGAEVPRPASAWPGEETDLFLKGWEVHQKGFAALSPFRVDLRLLVFHEVAARGNLVRWGFPPPPFMASKAPVINVRR